MYICIYIYIYIHIYIYVINRLNIFQLRITRNLTKYEKVAKPSDHHCISSATQKWDKVLKSGLIITCENCL